MNRSIPVLGIAAMTLLSGCQVVTVRHYPQPVRVIETHRTVHTEHHHEHDQRRPKVVVVRPAPPHEKDHPDRHRDQPPAQQRNKKRSEPETSHQKNIAPPVKRAGDFAKRVAQQAETGTAKTQQPEHDPKPIAAVMRHKTGRRE